MSNKTPRRRVIISSDEDSDVDNSKNSNILSESGDEDVDDSVVAESDDGEGVDESVVAESEVDEDEEETENSVPTTPSMKNARASLVSSTPLNGSSRLSNYKTPENESLDETFDRMSVGDASAATRSLSNSSVENNDRDRSFHGREVEESPISKRLGGQSDLKSKQALRERLLRKQATAARGANASPFSSDRSSSLLNSNLSPIGLKPIPKATNDESSRSASSMSDMDTRTPLLKSPSTLPGTRDTSMSRESGGMEGSRSESGSGSNEGSMERSEGGNSSSASDKENEGKKIIRKKLNMENVVVKKEKEEDKVRKFMTPRKTTKIEESDEEGDVKTEAYPNIESDEEGEMKKDQSIIDIMDSDEEIIVKKKYTDAVYDVDPDSDNEDDVDIPPDLLKEEEDDAAVVLASDPSASPPRPMPSLSATSTSSSTALHPTTMKTFTDDDVATMERDLSRLMSLLDRPDMKLPDGGAQLRRKIEELTTKIENARLAQPARRVAPPQVKGKLQLIDPHHDEDRIVVDDGLTKKKLVGGVMTDDRVANVKKITNDTLNKMHKEVTSQPDGEETPTPRGLRVDLMGHQKTGLTWMLWREKQSAPGGILADDMGLGKTMSMISLVMHTKNERLAMENEEEEKYEEREAKYKKMCNAAGLVPSHTTLVIAPASVIFQWEAEINKRVKGSRLSVLVFHGPKNKREDRPKKLAKYDIVITTYNIITSELTEKVDLTRDNSDGESESDDDDARFGKKAAVAADGKSKTRVSKSQISVLTKVHWDRIILDEAHQIKNRNSLISKAVCRLRGGNKWCLTGTPVHNNLYDLFSLVRFLKVNPFDELALWKENIMNAGERGSQRLNTLVKSLLLRRMKNEVDAKTNKPLVSLAPKNYEIHELTLEGLEKSIYGLMFEAVKAKVSNFMEQQEDDKKRDLFGRSRRRVAEKGGEDGEPVKNPFLMGPREINTNDKFQAMSCILVLLLRLRQAVVHLSLTKEAMDLSTFEGLSMETSEEALDAELSQLSLDESPADTEGMKATEKDVERIFRKTFLSTKIRILLDKLDHATQSGDKCVVVSQWTSVLKIIEYHIRKRDIEFTEITGEIATCDRQERVDSFNRVDGGAQVMLLSLTAGGVGLNLVGGNHLFLVDLHWNPALESQACDRIYRMGQTKNVFIHKLLSKNTIEETILALQNRKSALAKSVLEGAASKALNKLTMADLKFLFDLDGEQKRKELMDEEAKKAQQQYPHGAAAAAAARVPPPHPIHSNASLNYNNAVYGGATNRPNQPAPIGYVKGGKVDPDVITL